MRTDSCEIRLLRHLCKFELNDHDLASIGDHLSSFAVDLLVHLASVNKVIPQVHRNVTVLRGRLPERPSLEQLQRTLESRYADSLSDAFYARLKTAADNIVRMLDLHEVPFLLLKGGAFFDVYPDHHKRQIRDLDLLFPDLPAAWKAVALLQERGYTLGRPPYLKQDPNRYSGKSRLQGLVCLERTEDGQRYEVECMARSFIIAPFASYGSFGLGAGAHLPSAEDLVVFLCAHAYSHGYFILRDVNDTKACIEKFDLDWRLIIEKAKKAGLSAGLAFLLHEVCALYGARPELKEALNRLPVGRVAQWSLYRLPHYTGDFDPCFVSADVGIGKMLSDFLPFIPFYGLLAYDIVREREGIVAALKAASSSPIYQARLRWLKSPFADRWIEWLGRAERRRMAGPGMPSFPRGEALYLLALGSPGSIKQISSATLPELNERALAAGMRSCCFPDDEVLYLRGNGLELVIAPSGVFLPTRYAINDETVCEAAETFASHLLQGTSPSRKEVIIDALGRAEDATPRQEDQKVGQVLP